MNNKIFDNQDGFSFYSEKMFLSKKDLNHHHLKFTYQKQLISNLELKHKQWAKFSSELPYSH